MNGQRMLSNGPPNNSFRSWLSLAIVLGLGCTSNIPAAKPTRPNRESGALQVQWSRTLHLDSLQDIARELEAPLPGKFELNSGTTDHPQVVRTCEDLLALDLASDVGFTGPERDWQRLTSYAVRCMALQMLLKAHSATATLLGKAQLSAQVLDTLPPVMGLQASDEAAERAQLAARNCVPWRSYEPALRPVGQAQDELSVAGEDWQGQIVYYARADFDADGYEDLLLRRDGHVLDGSYGLSTLFLLTRRPEDRCLRVLQQFN
jgi:hypothetical protein